MKQILPPPPRTLALWLGMLLALPVGQIAAQTFTGSAVSEAQSVLAVARPEPCGVHKMRQAELAADPQAAGRYATLQQYVQQRLATTPASSGNPFGPGPVEPSTYVIPIIFHVFYYNDSNRTYNSAMSIYITQAQVQGQLDALNNDMQLLNADATNMNSGFRAYFAARPANARIRFCLARRNPQGVLLPEPGIDRFLAPQYYYEPQVSSTGPFPKSPSRGGVAAWPTTDYLNVWVCDIAGGPRGEYGPLGVATLPGNTNQPDGILIHTTALGVGGTAIVNGARFGRSLTHEVGHWLNLEHIWGTSQVGDCYDTDYVADTPNQFGPSFTVYNGPCKNVDQNGCNSPYPGELFMDFMDYGSDQCRYMFTQGQVDRMRLMLDPVTPFSRAPLLNSLALAPTRAGITHTLTSTMLCPGNQSRFQVRADFPDGFPCAGVVSYQWTIPAGWTISSAALGAPFITPNGTSGGTIGLTVTYTNGSSSLTLTAPPLTLTLGGPAPAAPTFSSGGDMCLGDVRTFAVQPVAGASSYAWQLPAGFTISGTPTGSSIQLQAPALNSSAATATPYTISVSAIASSGCASNSTATNFWLGTGESEITLNPAISNGAICANTVVLAAVTIPTRDQGTNSNFQWTQVLIAGTPNGCQNRTVGADTYTYTPDPRLPANQIRLFTGIANSRVQVWVNYDNSCGGHKQATVIFNTLAIQNGNNCTADVYCARPAATTPPTSTPYPNPTTGFVTVEQLAGRYQLYNGQGHLIQETVAAPGKTVLDLRHRPVGLYQLVGQDATGRAVRYHIQVQP